VAILLQDYPFAFGDILLKRMLALGALVALTLAGVFGLVRSPILADVGADLDRPEFVGSLLTLVAGLALVYPWIRAKAAAFVDSVVLKRADPTVVLASLTRLASEREDVDTLITEAGAVLTTALSSPPARWDAGLGVANGEGPSCALASVAEGEASRHIVPVSLESDGRCARVILPTSDPPHPAAVIGPLAGGRRLLVADVALLQNASTVLARRIDAIRIEHERVERRWREQEMARLAVDAELRALRAQLNPHFLFNALTTIGYLVKTAPDQAVHTLLRLTEVLRRALRQDEAIVTLASELQMVEAYLDIERARFEERLRVTVDVPDEVKHIRIPAFVLQPLVENAVKHGVAPSRTGGLVSVRARVRTAAVPVLELTVSDTGRGRDGSAGGHDGQGIGLANVRRRLELAYGADASIRFAADPDGGAEVTVTIPCPDFRAGRDPGRQERPTEGPLS